MKRKFLILLACLPIVSNAYYMGGVVSTTTMQTVSMTTPMTPMPMVAPMYPAVYGAPMMPVGMVGGMMPMSPCQVQNNYMMAPQPVMMPRPVVFY